MRKRKSASPAGRRRRKVKDDLFLVIGDFGKDLDDEDTLVLQDGERRHRMFLNTRGSRRQDLFDLKAVVANLAPPLKRAMLAKGTLNQLGQPNVPVGIGTDCNNDPKGHDAEFENIPYLASEVDLEHGGTLLVKTLEAAVDGSVTLVLISGLTDVANLMREHPDLVTRKLRCAAIMGGVKQENDKVQLDSEGYMVPDTAANNNFDMPAAIYAYRRLQELAIPLIILTREAAYACKVPRSIYDDMAATGHPVGIKLRDSQKRAIEDVWRRANLPPDDPGRAKLPNRCNKEWFCNTFCDGQGMKRASSDSIWDLIQTFNLYDPMTLVAAVPELRRRFYQPVTVHVHGTKHLIIGVSKNVHGVKHPQKLARFMARRCLKALTDSLAEQSQEKSQASQTGGPIVTTDATAASRLTATGPPSDVILSLVDAPDPDNFVQQIALHKLNPDATIHVALTGRPVRFNATTEHKNWEWDVESSRMAQEASAQRLRNFLRHFDVTVSRVFDGGIAPRTLVPHHLHFNEYYKFLDCDPLAALRHSELDPQEELIKLLLACPEKSVKVAVGGPMTGLYQLIVRNPVVASRFKEIHAMFATWGTVELMQFGDKPRGALQFNVACDPQAAHAILTGLDVPIYLMPTEVTRVKAIGFQNAQELREALPATRGTAALYNLYALWYDAAVKPRQDKNPDELIYIHDVVSAFSLDEKLRKDIYKVVPIKRPIVPYLPRDAAEWGKVIMKRTRGATNLFAATGLTQNGAAIYKDTLRQIFV
jgi:inosine-uridine nucleoside N-ribohydrolase